MTSIHISMINNNITFFHNVDHLDTMFVLFLCINIWILNFKGGEIWLHTQADFLIWKILSQVFCPFWYCLHMKAWVLREQFSRPFFYLSEEGSLLLLQYCACQATRPLIIKAILLFPPFISPHLRLQMWSTTPGLLMYLSGIQLRSLDFCAKYF